MGGIFQRMSLIFRAKTDKALDKLEDPRQTLDYSYQRQLELLQKVRRGVADVATSRKRIELQANQLELQTDKLTQQAQKALEVGREDLAREALTRRSGLQQQLTDLQAQHAQLQGEEEKLTRASQRLQAKVDAFRTRKETIKATYSAAEAQTRINEAFSGISEEMGDVGLAIQRAEDKTAQMQARAGAHRRAAGQRCPGRPDRHDQGRHHPRAGAAGLDLRRRERARPDEGVARRRTGAPPAGDREPALRGSGSGCRRPRAYQAPEFSQPPAPTGPAGPARPAEPGGAPVIVRILSEGQWELDDAAVGNLNQLDDAVDQAVGAEDQGRLTAALAAAARRGPLTRHPPCRTRICATPT